MNGCRISDESTLIRRHTPVQTQGSSRDETNLHTATERIVVTGAFPNDEGTLQRSDFVEVIDDPTDSSGLAFLHWNNGVSEVVREIERVGKLYVPTQKRADLVAEITLPNGVRPSGGTQRLAADLESAVSRFVDINSFDLPILVSDVLASWVPECFETAPYVWLVGPLGSAKTTLLKVLSCLCRRSVLVGDRCFQGWESQSVI
jgi:hypothetical protein